MLKNEFKSGTDYRLLNMNLQLFADDINDTQSGVVDQKNGDELSNNGTERRSEEGSQEENEFDLDGKLDYEELDTDSGSDDSDADGEESSKDSEVAGTNKPKQSEKENSVYQKIRRQAVADGMKEVEKEKEKLERDRQQIENYNIRQKHLGAVTKEQIEALAYEKGWPEDAAQEVLTNNAMKMADKEIGDNLRHQEMYRLQKESFKTKPYFNLVESKIDEFVKSNPGADMEGTYKYFLGELTASGKMDEIIKKEKSNTQKATIADIQDRSRRKSISGGDGGGASNVDALSVLSKQDIEMCKSFGNDPQEIAKIVAGKLKNKKK